MIDVCTTINQCGAGTPLLEEWVLKHGISIQSNIKAVTYFVAKGSKHERCSLVLIQCVHTKHHHKVGKDPRSLSYGCSHVEWVWIVHSATEKERVEEWGGRKGWRSGE